MIRQLFAALTLLSLASAFDTGVYGAGVWNVTYAREANLDPNATKSVPLRIDSQNYTFQVNVAEFTPTGSQANRTDNPHQVAAFYNLIWSGDYSLNDTLRNAWSLSQDLTPRLCASVPMGPLTLGATNNYKDTDEGDCSHALGSQCMKDLSNVPIGQVTVSCSARWLPDSCVSKLGDGGIASSALTGSTNATNDAIYQRSPREFAWYQSQIYSGTNSSYFEREVQRLHVVFFSGSTGDIYPVCLRVNDTRLKKNDGAVYNGAAASLGSSAYLSAALALGVAALVL